MRKIAILLILMMVTLFTAIFFIKTSHAAIIEVYPGESIQAAINKADHGDTIFVYSGNYTELPTNNNAYIFINKSINLVGEHQDTTIINCPKIGSSDYFGIFIQGNVQNLTIRNFRIVGDHYLFSRGIYGYPQTNQIRIENCTIYSFSRGIYLEESDNSLIKKCTIYDNSGTDDEYGGGIYITGGANHVIANCKSYSNSYGIYLENTQLCNLYHNNIYDNTVNAADNEMNTWYNTTLLQGNYYGDYTGQDTNGDGIGETPYAISGGSNQDLYPLINQFLNTHTITASASSGGIITPSGLIYVLQGTYRNFTMTSDTGYHINDVVVDNGSVGAVSYYNFTDVQEDYAIYASFITNQYTITASAGPGGTIKPVGAVVVDYGGYQNFSIMPDSGYHIVDVLVDGFSVGVQTWYNFSDVQANYTIYASFAQTSFTISASAGAGGSIQPSGAVEVDHGGHKNFTITPNTGYDIKNVLIDGGSVGAVTFYNFTDVQANHTISASFDGSSPPSQPPPSVPENEKPVADTSAGEPYQGYVNFEITFVGSNSYDLDGNITSWFWVFGDNTNGTGETVQHIYANSGTYTVTLTVTDNEGATNSATTTCVITLPNRPPTAPLITGPIEGMKNTVYTFTALSTDLDNDTLQYWFEWGDDSNSESSEFLANGTSFSLSHSWDAPGRYIVTIAVTDNQSTSSSNITVYIDAIQTGDIGYLTDDDGDGIYDTFHNEVTSLTTVVGKTESDYLIDSNGDGKWDYSFNIIKGLTEYHKSSTSYFDIFNVIGDAATSDSGLLIILAVSTIAVLLFCKRKLKKEDNE